MAETQKRPGWSSYSVDSRQAQYGPTASVPVQSVPLTEWIAFVGALIALARPSGAVGAPIRHCSGSRGDIALPPGTVSPRPFGLRKGRSGDHREQSQRGDECLHLACLRVPPFPLSPVVRPGWLRHHGIVIEAYSSRRGGKSLTAWVSRGANMLPVCSLSELLGRVPRLIDCRDTKIFWHTGSVGSPIGRGVG
jgi:hypothetical protein